MVPISDASFSHLRLRMWGAQAFHCPVCHALPAAAPPAVARPSPFQLSVSCSSRVSTAVGAGDTQKMLVSAPVAIFCSPPRFLAPIALSSCSNAHCAARRAGLTSIVYAFSWLRPITQSGAANTSKNVPFVDYANRSGYPFRSPVKKLKRLKMRLPTNVAGTSQMSWKITMVGDCVNLEIERVEDGAA